MTMPYDGCGNRPVDRVEQFSIGAYMEMMSTTVLGHAVSGTMKPPHAIDSLSGLSGRRTCSPPEQRIATTTRKGNPRHYRGSNCRARVHDYPTC